MRISIGRAVISSSLASFRGDVSSFIVTACPAGDAARESGLPCMQDERTLERFHNASDGRGMFEISHAGDVAVLQMAHGKANAMSLEFCIALTQRLEELRTSAARAVVITATGAIFSA